ncbi:dihydroorotate dehydrogenase electron transfer subunit [Desulfotalea psychrophila]|uniref:Dihydroorotate dehydrogenase B (NAD(+)), electron transfer subunit n=1 Tax=Desulfotalea psychrophila (strain LSv54 / DSM 12343) TaxID=177439 RepID=Q6AIT5_DESPS|nr:dihydroorotate dehydrogenase electron transfer subunit [Desulfotalea psychrophila]CAG37745.1 related to dihydroorotate dehydrogenase, electron transfer subunit [Desulfotalea psychrophila LSv54]
MAQNQENAIITSVEQLSAENFRMGFHAPKIAAVAHPGQFVMVRRMGSTDPLLRRPFCIHQVDDDGGLQLYFKVVGRGTKLLSQLTLGEELSILGPLGKGFALVNNRPACLVGGGLGIAPLLFLTRKLAEGADDPSQIRVILGGRSRAEVEPLVADFEQYGVQVFSTTDDGSFVRKGFVTEVLQEQALVADCQVYTCGPEAMMARVFEHCQEKGLACQVSVEKEMACGIGACLGCCKTKADGTYTHVCINGPVYNAEELQWKK